MDNSCSGNNNNCSTRDNCDGGDNGNEDCGDPWRNSGGLHRETQKQPPGISADLRKKTQEFLQCVRESMGTFGGVTAYLRLITTDEENAATSRKWNDITTTMHKATQNIVWMHRFIAAHEPPNLGRSKNVVEECRKHIRTIAELYETEHKLWASKHVHNMFECDPPKYPEGDDLAPLNLMRERRRNAASDHYGNDPPRFVVLGRSIAAYQSQIDEMFTELCSGLAKWASISLQHRSMCDDCEQILNELKKSIVSLCLDIPNAFLNESFQA